MRGTSSCPPLPLQRLLTLSCLLFLLPLPPSIPPPPPSPLTLFPHHLPFRKSSPSQLLIPLVFQHAKHQPQVLKYLRALVQGTKYLPSLSYTPTAPDHKGRLYPRGAQRLPSRLYPRPIGAQRLPKAIRTLLFGFFLQ